MTEVSARGPSVGPRWSVATTWLAEVCHRLDPGEVASLRRIDTDAPSCPAYWRLVASLAPGAPTDLADDERRAAVILRAFADLRDVHRAGRRLGFALAEAGFDERRLLQLLRAHGNALAHAVRTASHYLVSRGVRVDAMEIVRLVVTDGAAGEDDERRRVARDYFRATATQGR